MAAKLNDFDGVKSSARDDGNGGLVTDIHLKSQEKPLQVDFPSSWFGCYQRDPSTIPFRDLE
ncbi:hypothetical protein P5495_018765 [Bacillus velezensis]|uniref:hypothetical protein n=1 Tax=Bacillus velezensis TaxID=492670 RepID=UPI003E80F1F0